MDLIRNPANQTLYSLKCNSDEAYDVKYKAVDLIMNPANQLLYSFRSYGDEDYDVMYNAA